MDDGNAGVCRRSTAPSARQHLQPLIPLLGLESEPDQPGRVRNNTRQSPHLDGWCEATSGPAYRGLLS
ncbi:hypothetical protein XFF6990_140584 [Xanthomonas citri pv. fuscans]|uniref:Uncharacterized protein n=1 Tax=Xanthomonas campestris pv. phaseoli TaxID=317013 RepID=A0A7Z7IXW5_XANCH|nr:hypothetical protein XFF6990_140584 [Xanthomonas citri pv. fuscans]SOO22525.1 hypothetical protein XFF6991_150286 [Xanthomonas phaseoli pv. phaseoli]